MSEQLPLPGILAAVQGPLLGPNSPGVKHDAGKSDWYIMPWTAMAEVQAVIDFGAKKYHEDNWHRVEARRYFSAAMRHMLAWRAGRDKDDESGLPHLAHAISCLLFILGQELKETQRGNA